MRAGSGSRVWTVQIDLEETEDQTEAKAILHLGAERIGGWGRARRNPIDPSMPRVGEELAVSRALSDLAHQLVERAGDLLEGASKAAKVDQTS
ncbi:MAG: dsRBD fold-containing protein [Acidimicrobiales bacterium]